MNKTFFPLLLVATLVTAPAYAFDSSDPFGIGQAAEKPAKAVREKNDGRFLETMAKSFGTGVGVGAAGVAAMGVTALPLLAVGGSLVIGRHITDSSWAKVNSFYSGTVSRGRVFNVVDNPRQDNFGQTSYWNGIGIAPDKYWGFDLKTFPQNDVLKMGFDILHVDVNGPSESTVFAIIAKGSGIQKGDIVDIKSAVGVFALNTKVFDGLHFDFNKHMPRVVNVYCKHDNPACQNDYESSLGVLSRHQDKEFPPSQYLIDPAIIAADQVKMRKEEEERKAASNNGGFSFM